MKIFSSPATRVALVLAFAATLVFAIDAVAVKGRGGHNQSTAYISHTVIGKAGLADPDFNKVDYALTSVANGTEVSTWNNAYLPDTGRNLTVTPFEASGSALIVGITVHGVNQFGKQITETFTGCTAAAPCTGSKIFKYLTKFVVDTNTDDAASDLLDIGYGGKLGMIHQVASESQVIIERSNGGSARTSKVQQGTDFIFGALADELFLSSTAGSGTGNATAPSAGRFGRYSLTTASDDGAHSANGTGLGFDALTWFADTGGLVMETRLQIDAVTAVALFVGFTDAISTTVEAPIFMVAGDIDSDATDAAGLIFDTDGTTDVWTCGGVKNGTDTAPVQTTTAPAAATYYTIRVEITAAGAVTCYVDGVAVGAAAANAVTVTVGLTPHIFVHNRGAAARVMLVDYIHAESNRSGSFVEPALFLGSSTYVDLTYSAIKADVIGSASGILTGDDFISYYVRETYDDPDNRFQ